MEKANEIKIIRSDGSTVSWPFKKPVLITEAIDWLEKQGLASDSDKDLPPDWEEEDDEDEPEEEDETEENLKGDESEGDEGIK